MSSADKKEKEMAVTVAGRECAMFMAVVLDRERRDYWVAHKGNNFQVSISTSASSTTFFEHVNSHQNYVT